MSPYEPGTVAVATVRGVKGVRVFCTTNTTMGHVEWALGERVARFDGDSYGSGFAKPHDVTDVRPLVVLDLDEYDSQKFAGILRAILRGEGEGGFAGPWARTADSVADQIEAQTKPPRIPEPGLWGVVEASRQFPDGKGFGPAEWVHTNRAGTPWYCAQFDVHAGWHLLIDPTLIREGVES